MTSAELEARVNSSTELGAIDMDIASARLLASDAPLVMSTPAVLLVAAVLFASGGLAACYASRCGASDRPPEEI